jgi:hypothetical protein
MRRAFGAALVLLLACSNDTFVSDDTSSSDAGGDATTDAPPGTFCSALLSKPFCMDFDEQTSLVTAFELGNPVTISPPVTSLGCTAVHGSDGVLSSGDVAMSAPAIPSAATAADAEYQTPLNGLGLTLTANSGSATLHFSMRIDSYSKLANGTSSALLALIVLTDAASTSNTFYAGIGVDAASQMFLTLQGAPTTVIPIPAAGWHAYDIILTLSNAGNDAALQLKIDTNVAGTNSGTIGTPIGSPRGNFNVGISAQPPFNALVAHFDNITFDAN